MKELLRIKKIKVQKLQDQFDYKIDFVGTGDTAILIAPNGYGKTSLLSLLRDCLRFRFEQAAESTFLSLEVTFDNRERWVFEKVRRKESVDQRPVPVRSTTRYPRRRTYVRPFHIDFKGYDAKNRIIDKKPIDIEAVPLELLVSALDQTLPVVYLGAGDFRMQSTSEILSSKNLVYKYWDFLRDDTNFRKILGQYGESLFDDALSINVVFIEARRLEASRSSAESSGDRDGNIEREEIVLQSQKLASMLRRAYAEYATVSQRLDRTFPNRLVERVYQTKPSRQDLRDLKNQLATIEMRRKSFAEAGILSSSEDSLAVPTDEAFEKVADALEIYIEDSTSKLQPLEELYGRISVFKELMDKKFSPKKLIFGTEFGARVQKGQQTFQLNSLSSGEKHEFVMLFKLIFETPYGSLVLVDEPEISLHVVWQLEFMSDLRKVMDLNKLQCIIATHSPQIFQNSQIFLHDLAEQVA